MSINRVAISGNLTRDPDLRASANGTQILNLGVAVNDRRRNAQTGGWEDHPNFIDCVIFGQRAESLSRILRKGSKVAIEGKLRQNTWQDKQTGQKRSKVDVIVDDVDFMSSKNTGAGQGGYQTNPQSSPQQPQAYQPAREPRYQQPRIVGAEDAPF